MPAKRRPFRTQTIVAMILLAAAGLAAYGNTFAVPFVFDDVPSIIENPTIQSWRPPWKPLWPPRDADRTVAGRPALNFTLAINHAISGKDPWSYHVVNLGIHFVAGLTMFGLLRRLLPMNSLATGPPASDHLALAATLLWLVHPLHTSAVTYVVQRAESQMAMLYLLTLLASVRSMTAATSSGARLWRWIAVATCGAGMATKENMASAPIMVFLIDGVLISGEWRSALSRHRRLYAGLALTWILLAILVFTSPRLGLIGDARLSAMDYALTQAGALVHMLWLSVWPRSLTFDYGEADAGVTIVRSIREVWWQAALVGGLAIGTMIALLRKQRIGLAGALFLMVLAPSSSIVPIHAEVIAEHRMYLPLAAVVAVLVVAFWTALRAVPGLQAARAGIAGWAFVLALAAALMIATRSRNSVHQREESLWADTVVKRPLNVRARYNLGLAVGRQGRLDEEMHHYRLALAMAPGDAKANNNLGRALRQQGDLAGAERHFRQAIRSRPDYAMAHYNLGIVAAVRGDLSQAISQFETAARLDPLHFESRNNLGKALAATGDYPGAVAAYNAALALDRNSAEAWYNLGAVQLMAGRNTDAEKSLRHSLELDPSRPDAHYNLGLALWRQQRLEPAVQAMHEALRLRPNHELAKSALRDLEASATR